VGGPNLIDPNGAVALEYGVFGPPESFFIDAGGIVRYKLYGPVTWSVLDAQLPALFPEISSAPAEVQ
jgi:cytochrome c biogenesis protein CcmG/thiol:disulfide interchange protein DsbE